MDASLIITGAIALLRPLMVKAGEKAAETIGEKMAEKTVTKSFWKKVERLFIVDDDEEVIKAIESKPVATKSEVAIIENKIRSEAAKNPQFVEEIKESLNINATNEFLITEKFESICRLQEEIKNLERQMERAGIATSGDYLNRIELQTDKLAYQSSQVLEILNP